MRLQQAVGKSVLGVVPPFVAAMAVAAQPVDVEALLRLQSLVPAEKPKDPIQAVVQQLSDESPSWFRQIALADGTADYFTRLDNFLDGPDANSNAVITQPPKGMLGTPDVFKRFLQAQGWFQALKMDSLVRLLDRTPVAERKPLMQKLGPMLGNRLHINAEQFHAMIAELAELMPEPSDAAQRGDVKGYQSSVKALRQHDPDWLESQGLAASVGRSIDLLKGCFRLYFPHLNPQLPEHMAVEAPSAGGLLMPPKLPEIPPTSMDGMEKLAGAFRHYQDVVEAAGLDDLDELPSERREQALKEQAESSPDTIATVASDMHEVVKSIAPTLAQLKLGQTSKKTESGLLLVEA